MASRKRVAAAPGLALGVVEEQESMMSLVGLSFKKKFPGCGAKLWKGKVVGHEGEKFRVTYEDGNTAVMQGSTIKKLLEAGKAKAPAKGKAKAPAKEKAKEKGKAAPNTKSKAKAAAEAPTKGKQVKVAELKERLEELGLPTTGLKKVLEERLAQAEGGDGEPDEGISSSSSSSSSSASSSSASSSSSAASSSSSASSKWYGVRGGGKKGVFRTREEAVALAIKSKHCSAKLVAFDTEAEADDFVVGSGISVLGMESMYPNLHEAYESLAARDSGTMEMMGDLMGGGSDKEELSADSKKRLAELGIPVEGYVTEISGVDFAEELDPISPE
jgi:hypothetical protein